MKTRIENTRIRKSVTLFILIIGILLFAVSLFIEKSKEQPGDEYSKYCTYLENKLCEKLETIVGKGQIDAMITLESNYTAANEDRKQAVFDQDQNAVEIPLPKIAGVMIVCKNITNETDFIHIKKAAATVLGINENKIYIIGGAQDHEKNIQKHT